MRKFRFKGEDGSMGFRTGQVYYLRRFFFNNYTDCFEAEFDLGLSCPYSTIGKFLENWEELE